MNWYWWIPALIIGFFWFEFYSKIPLVMVPLVRVLCGKPGPYRDQLVWVVGFLITLVFILTLIGYHAIKRLFL